MYPPKVHAFRDAALMVVELTQVVPGAGGRDLKPG